MGDVGLGEEHSRWETSDSRGRRQVFLKHWFTEPKKTSAWKRCGAAQAARHRTLETCTCLSENPKDHRTSDLKDMRKLNGLLFKTKG